MGNGISVEIVAADRTPNFPFEIFHLLDYYFLSNFQYTSKFSHTFNNFCMKFWR